MFPQLVLDKIYFYLWKSKINHCNKQYHDSLSILKRNAFHPASKNLYEDIYVQGKSYNQRDIRLTFYMFIRNYKSPYSVVASLPTNYF